MSGFGLNGLFSLSKICAWWLCFALAHFIKGSIPAEAMYLFLKFRLDSFLQFQLLLHLRILLLIRRI